MKIGKYTNPNPILLALVSFLIGLTAKLSHIVYWIRQKEVYMDGNIPLIQNPDGFFFARLIRDGAESPDFLRNYPFYVEYDLIHGIYYVGRFLYKLTGLPVEWIGVIMDAVLSNLFVFPLVLFFSSIGYPIVGFFASLLTALSPVYFSRTQINTIDTDTLNLFFPLLNAYLGLVILRSKGFWFFVYSFLFILSNLLHYLWYLHPQFLVASSVGLLVFLALNKKFKESVFLAVCFALLGFAYFNLNILHLLKHVASYHEDIVMQTIAEQAKVSFKHIFTESYANWIFPAIGLIWFFRLGTKSLLFLPLILLTLLAFKQQSVRLFFYVEPLVAMGLSMLAWDLYKLFSFLLQGSNFRLLPRVFLIVFFVALLPWNFLLFNKPTLSFPKSFWQDLRQISEYVPEKGVILTWWDWGYAIQYYVKRATFHDGGTQTGNIKTRLIAKALLSDTESAYKIISAISNRETLEKLEQFTWQEAINYLNTTDAHPPENVYFLITRDMINKIPAFNKIAEAKINEVMPIYCEPKDCEHYLDNKTQEYVFKYVNNYTLAFEIGSYVEYREGNITIQELNPEKKLIMFSTVANDRRYFYVLRKDHLEILLTKLYLMPMDYPHFKLVYNRFPNLVLYKVVP